MADKIAFPLRVVELVQLTLFEVNDGVSTKAL